MPLAVSSPALVTSFPGPVSGGWFALEDSPWAGPFPPATPPTVPQHHLCSPPSSVLRTCPTAVDRSSPHYSLDSRCRQRCFALPALGSPDSRSVSFLACPALRPRRGRTALRLCDPSDFCLPHISRRSALQTLPNFRGSITQPASSPVNACSIPSQIYRHDSGPVRLTSSLLYDSFIHYLLPVLIGAV